MQTIDIKIQRLKQPNLNMRTDCLLISFSYKQINQLPQTNVIGYAFAEFDHKLGRMVKQE